MLRWITTLFLLVIGYAPPCSAATATIHSFSQVHDLLDSLDANALVVFDVDRVLIEHEDRVLQAHNLSHLNTLFLKHYDLIQPDTYTTMQFFAKPKLIENHIVEKIAALQEKNIPVIALTATGIGSLPKIGSIQSWRVQRLQELGLSFSFQEHPFHSFSELRGLGPSPVFQNGILFSAKYSKGSVLKAFLEKIGFTPSTVIFFDDMLYNVTSIQDEMTTLGIKNIFSFHYLGAHSFLEAIDLYLAEQQILHLLQNNEWLNETACKNKLDLS